MSTPGQSNDPKAPAPVVVFTKQDAARVQLETAILIWFHYGDTVSIQALAYAANDCYHAMIKGKGVAIVQTWLKSLSKPVYDRIQFSLNFSKHGWKNLKGKAGARTEYGELLILDSIACHEQIFQAKTPLMSCFFGRFGFEHPLMVEHMPPVRREYFQKIVGTHKLGKMSRMDYLNEVLPKFTGRLSAKRG